MVTLIARWAIRGTRMVPQLAAYFTIVALVCDNILQSCRQNLPSDGSLSFFIVHLTITSDNLTLYLLEILQNKVTWMLRDKRIYVNHAQKIYTLYKKYKWIQNFFFSAQHLALYCVIDSCCLLWHIKTIVYKVLEMECMQNKNDKTQKKTG